MDIQKSNYGYPKFSRIFGYPKMDFWLFKNELWISKTRIIDILKLNSVRFLDIQKCILGYPKIQSNYGYPKFSMTFGYPKMYFYVFLDIQKWIMDIQKWIMDSLKWIFDIHTLEINSKTAPQMAPGLGQKSLVTKTTWCRPNHCGCHLGKINGLNSTYVKVWRCTFGRITRVLMGKSWG